MKDHLIGNSKGARLIARRRVVLAAAAAAALAALAAPRTAGGAYTFTKLVDATGDIQQFMTFGAALNDSEQVAFLAHMDNGEYAIIRADGQAETVIASTADFDSFDYMADINNAGLVAFQASVILPGGPRPAVYVGDGDTLTVVGPANPDPYGDNYNFGELNAAGQVMMGRLAPNSVPFGVAIGAGGPPNNIYDSSHFGGNGALFVGDLTDTGYVTVIAGPVPGAPRYVYRGDVGGSLPLCIVGEQEFNAGIGSVAVNNAGNVLFTATQWVDPIGYRSGLYLWAGGATGCDVDPDDEYVTIAHEDGPFAAFDPNGMGPAINDAMQIAFKATLDEGGHGIYSGPDPTADKVIAMGDPLDGSTASYLSMHRFGINAAGQIAFYAVLADGREGMYLATPNLCPADVNGDGQVNVLDLLQLLSAWNAAGGPEDINGDGIVDVLDLLELLGAWGPCA